MRDRTLENVKSALRSVLGPILASAAETAQSRHEDLVTRSEDLAKAVAVIQPAQVDLTQEMADDIVRKIHGPFTISKDCSDWLRKLAPGHDFNWTTPVGYSHLGGQLLLIIKTNGTLFIELRDMNGANMWQATLVPPDFGKETVSGT